MNGGLRSQWQITPFKALQEAEKKNRFFRAFNHTDKIQEIE
jgi:hypothetical protein